MTNTRIHLAGLLALSCVLGVTACNPDPQPVANKPTGLNPSYIAIWTDKKSGCDYIIVERASGVAVTKRMWSDGVQMCWHKESTDG